MSEINLWQYLPPEDVNNYKQSSELDELAALRAELAEVKSDLEKALDELNCTEVELEVASCSLPVDKFNDGFECMGDFVRAVVGEFKVALAEQDAEIAHLRADAARLDWLDSYTGLDSHISVWKSLLGVFMVDVGNGGEFEDFKTDRIVDGTRTVREAIDAAREENTR